MSSRNKHPEILFTSEKFFTGSFSGSHSHRTVIKETDNSDDGPLMRYREWMCRLIVEHKSAPDPWVHVQLAHYLTGLWVRDRGRRGNRPPPSFR